MWSFFCPVSGNFPDFETKKRPPWSRPCMRGLGLGIWHMQPRPIVRPCIVPFAKSFLLRFLGDKLLHYGGQLFLDQKTVGQFMASPHSP